MATKYIVNNVSGQTINGQSFVPPYKVYTALLTQSGGNDPISVGGGSLTIGITYQIVDNGGNGWDFTNVGSPNNDIGTYFVATGTTPTSWGVDGQLDYNEGAPVVTVLENTIGNIWFTYGGGGQQFINSDNLFTIGKTYATIQLNTELTAPDATFYSIQQNGDSTMNLFSYIPINDLDGTPFTNTPIEIRVYN